jgi:hypothetical protein
MSPLTKETEVIPDRDGKTNSWMRIDGTGFIRLNAS